MIAPSVYATKPGEYPAHDGFWHQTRLVGPLEAGLFFGQDDDVAFTGDQPADATITQTENRA